MLTVASPCIDQVATVLAREAFAVGISLILSPVCDLRGPCGVIGSRAFSPDAQVVADCVETFIEVAQREGVDCAAKHWPGHGSATADSHKELPKWFDFSSRRTNLEEFEEEQITPFRRAISKGVSAILVGHIDVMPWEPSGTRAKPATVSPAVVSRLREEQFR